MFAYVKNNKVVGPFSSHQEAVEASFGKGEVVFQGDCMRSDYSFAPTKDHPEGSGYWMAETVDGQAVFVVYESDEFRTERQLIERGLNDLSDKELRNLCGLNEYYYCPLEQGEQFHPEASESIASLMAGAGFKGLHELVSAHFQKLRKINTEAALKSRSITKEEADSANAKWNDMFRNSNPIEFVRAGDKCQKDTHRIALNNGYEASKQSAMHGFYMVGFLKKRAAEARSGCYS